MKNQGDNIESRIKNLLDYYVDYEQDPRFVKMVWSASMQRQVLSDDELAIAVGGISREPHIPLEGMKAPEAPETA
jgi:hypothetical protein